jgi:hypothetical protein
MDSGFADLQPAPRNDDGENSRKKIAEAMITNHKPQ